MLPGGAPGSVYVVPIPCEGRPARSAVRRSAESGALRVGRSRAAARVLQRDGGAARQRGRCASGSRRSSPSSAERSDQLAAVNKELEAFSYSVSHDLRAPLRHISGFTELLQKSPGADLDRGRQRYLRLISESAVKMGELIDSLLVFSRMGRAEMLHTRVDLNAVVRRRSATSCRPNPARPSSGSSTRCPTVPGDPSMLQLVFTNLLSNAFKYSRTRQDATIEVGSQNGSSKEAVMFVQDNGVGFDMAYANRLFGVFQRLHRAEEFEGTGIGLANVQRIVSRHGGRVWAESELGKGATFYVALPVSD